MLHFISSFYFDSFTMVLNWLFKIILGLTLTVWVYNFILFCARIHPICRPFMACGKSTRCWCLFGYWLSWIQCWMLETNFFSKFFFYHFSNSFFIIEWDKYWHNFLKWWIFFFLFMFVPDLLCKIIGFKICN